MQTMQFGIGSRATLPSVSLAFAARHGDLGTVLHPVRSLLSDGLEVIRRLSCVDGVLRLYLHLVVSCFLVELPLSYPMEQHILGLVDHGEQPLKVRRIGRVPVRVELGADRHPGFPHRPVVPHEE